MDKTKFSIFNENLIRAPDKTAVLYDKEEVKKTSDYVYVGIIFSTDKKQFKSNLDNVAHKVNKAIFKDK